MTYELPPRTVNPTRVAAFFAVAAAIVIATVAYYMNNRHVTQISGAMLRQAYILRPNWSDPLEKAVAEDGPSFDELVIFAGEVYPESGIERYSVNPLDYDWLSEHNLRVGLLIAINDPPDVDAEPSLLICAQEILTRATKSGLKPVEFQLDFSAAPSQIVAYEKWINDLRNNCSLPISVIGSVQMLNNGFAPVTRAAGTFVLRASADNDNLIKGVNIVARLGVPFRIALSSSTGASDPRKMADLMRTLIAGRPRFLQTAIWNNFSSDDDYAVWNYKCLDSVMNGVTPEPDLQLLVRNPDKNLSEIDLVNKGTADGPFSSKVSVSWNSADLVEAQALPDFDRTDTGRRSMDFTPQASLASKPIRPGEQRKVGWVRLTDDSPVFARIANPGD